MMMRSRQQRQPFSLADGRPFQQSRRRTVLIPLSRSRQESIRTNLWAVPTVMVVLVVGLFTVTYSMDRRAAAGVIALPAWLSFGGPDVAREVLIAIATSVITVA